VIRRPVTAVLGVLTFLLGAPTAFRLLGDHGVNAFVLAAAVVPLVLLPLAGLLVVQVLLRRRRLAALTAVLVVLNLVWLVPQYVPARVTTGSQLTVLQVNLRFGGADPFALVGMVQRHRVDVLAVQELTPEAVDALRGAGLDRELPFREVLPGRGPDGAGLWSRHPLDSLPAWPTRYPAPGAVVKTPGRDVVVRVVHPAPATIAAGAGQYRADYATLRRAVERLDPQVATVLVGDFNATVDNSELRDLMAGRFRDAAELAGDGLQRTWSLRPGWPPLLHLDHVLVDPHFTVRATMVLDLPGSDHEAVIARLVLT
jgi:endonuclease/exonuclease/phosphatase (EEP) superfamily protein YafD